MSMQKLLSRLARSAALAFAVLLTGCATPYLDGTTKEIPISEYKKPASPAPVQLLFEFQTKGVLNAPATSMLKDQVTAQVKASGLFSAVETGPVPGGATLSLTINNVPLTDDAFSKGFVTGLTFGLAGSQVTDGYVCSATFRATPSAEPITKKVRHAIHTSLGSGAAPSNAVKMPDLKTAAMQMGKDVVSNMLNDISRDANFK